MKRNIKVDFQAGETVEAAVETAAALVETLCLIGGTLTVLPLRRQVGEIAGEPEFETDGLLFRFDSFTPALKAGESSDAPAAEAAAATDG